MNKFLLIILFALCNIMFSQSAFYNAGNIEIHDGGQIGFHTDLENNGKFDGKKGLAGFYNKTNSLFIYGSEEVTFFKMQVDVQNDLELFTTVKIADTLSFINGKINTPRNDNSVNLSFIKKAIYYGEANNKYINGYATVRTGSAFVFPVGDNDRLRTVSIDNNLASQEFKAAYFFEDANFSTSLNKTFNTDSKQNSISNISTDEFWDVKGKSPVNITLTWDKYSDIGKLTNSINNLIIVGWNKASNEWENLGKVEVDGDLLSGSIKSTTIFPDDYEIFTIASGADIHNSINNIENLAVIQIRLFDITRRLIRTFTSGEEINFTGMAKGVYVADFYLSNGSRYSKKILNK